MIRTRAAAVAIVATFSGFACGDDGSSGGATSSGATSSGATSGGASGGSAPSGPNQVEPGGAGGPALTPAPLKAGWQKAFANESAGIDCGKSLEDMKRAKATTLTVGAATLVVGYEQIGDNQDPVFARFDGATQTYCEHHEREPPDGRAYGVTWDGGKVAYVVYTIVGGGSAFDAKGSGAWLNRYGDGGGSSKVSFVGEVETDRGTLVRGTFITAKKKDGKTNTHSPSDAPIVMEDGNIEFLGSSAFQPMNPDRSIMECTDYPFSTRYRFSPDLKTLTCSSSTNCTSKVPCPG